MAYKAQETVFTAPTQGDIDESVRKYGRDIYNDFDLDDPVFNDRNAEIIDDLVEKCPVAHVHPEQQPSDPAVRAAIWKDTIDTNLTGAWHTLEATVPILVEQGRGGAVVITSSTAGLKGSTYNDLSLTAYVAAKHGLTGLMRDYAKDYAQYSIRFNTVHPTGVHTPMPENEIMAGRLEKDPTCLRSWPTRCRSTPSTRWTSATRCSSLSPTPAAT